MLTHVALLRGINVGGKNKLPMAELVQMFADAGCTNVRHYIQSGNVVFTARSAIAEKVAAVVRKSITKKFGYDIPILVRLSNDLKRIVASNPFLGKRTPVEQLHVAFLADAPGKAAIAQLDSQRSPPDAFVVKGKEIFLQLPNGVGKTRFSNAYFDAKLSTVSTLRNWKTVLMLLEMSEA